MQPPDIIGYGAILAVSALSAAYLLLRVRQQLRETPDPKLTYATKHEVEQIRQHCQQNCRNFQIDLHEIDAKRSKSIALTHELIRKNSEHIASLIATLEITQQRVQELLIRTEKLMERRSNVSTSPH